MVEVKIELHDTEIKEGLARLEVATGGRLGAPMRQIGRLLKTSTQLRFTDQVGPDGKKWAPSKRVREHGGQTLRLTGRLRNSITYRAAESSVAVGTNVVYAAALQFGRTGTEKVKAHTRKVTVAFGRRLTHPVTANVRSFTRKLNLPPRPYIGVSQQDRTDILAILKRHLAGRAAGHE